MRPERKASGLLAAALLWPALAGAQLLGDRDSGWRDEPAPPPPALRTDGLIPLDVGPASALRFGVDPDSVSISPEGVVRYVVVAASSSGAVNAMYEGLQCRAGMVKVYARHTPGQGWSPAQGDWRPLGGGSSAVRHSLAIARQGACSGAVANGPVQRLLRDLARGGDPRLRNTPN